MYMADWIKKLNDILVINGRELLEHAGQICTREYLLSSVWHIKTPLLTRRVDAYITLLRKKLGLGKNELKCVVGHGYVLAEDGSASTPDTQE